MPRRIAWLLLLAVAFADEADDTRVAAAADHLRAGELKELLTKAGVEFGDCKEKEELIQRVLESGARALLPDLELDEMVIADDDSDSAEAEADGSSGGEASEQSPEPPAEEDNSAQPAAEEPGAEAEAGTAAPEEPEEPAEEAEVSENWRTRAEAAAAAPAAEYTKEKLMSDLGTVQMMGEMGLANQMMEVLTRITFGLADEDRDGQISRPEATAFATTHLRDGQPLVATLGIRGGALRLDDAAAVEQVVGAAFAACDANADNLVNSSEARATPCRKHMYELLVSAPQPAAAKPAAAAPAQPAAQPAGGAAAGAKDAWSDMFKNLGEKGAADRGGMSKPHPLFAQFERRLKRAQATLMRNLHDPNFNTFLAGLGVCAMLLQQALSFDIMNLRFRLRGLVGADVPDFLNRLQNVGLMLMAAGAMARFE